MSVDFSLKGKVAIVTGCSAGIGNGMAKGLAEAGADIYGVSSRGEFAEIKEAVETFGRRFEGQKANLMSVEPIEAIVSDCISKFGKIDILINNAGIIRREDAINFSEKDWDDVMNINLKTVFFFSQRVAREFIKQGGGKIINVASMLSYQGGIQVPSYTASKNGVKGITMELANEWAKYHINVNAVAPGATWVQSDQPAPALEPGKLNYVGEPLTDQVMDRIRRIPLGHWGEPQDVAKATLFLASPMSDFITGIYLPVDGGWLVL